MDRVLLSALGGAVGDSLGAEVEFLSLREIRARYGPDGVTDLVPAYGRLGRWTDDTQMLLFTAEGLRQGDVNAAYLRWYETQQRTSPPPGATGLAADPRMYARRAPGTTCLAALRAGGGGTPERPINDSKGCGTVMRAAPAGWFAASEREAWEAGVALSALTHGHRAGWESGGALAVMIRRLLDGAPPAEAVRVDLPPGETRAALAAALALEGPPTPERVESLGGGWTAETCLAIAVYTLLTTETFREGALAAVNHSGDSDSCAAVHGNLAGAAGRTIPSGWLEALEARDLIQSAIESSAL